MCLSLAAAAAGVVVAALAFAAAAAPGRVGAGSPRDSASSQRRVLITPSRDATWRWSLPPLRPLERERPRAAPSSMVAGGSPARNGASAAPRRRKDRGAL